VQVHFIRPPSPSEIGAAIAKWYADPNAVYRAYDRKVERSRFETAVDADDTRPGHENAMAMRTATAVLGAGGSFDITAALMKGDPWAANKRRFLDQTRAERVQIATDYRERQLKGAADTMRKRLAELATQTVSPGVAKQTLFEMWDECIDTGDAPAVSAGAEARLVVMQYIAVHFPATSADAFTVDELRLMNARKHSAATFAPY